MFSLVQTVRFYRSRFVFLFALRRFGVDFVSLILHTRDIFSLSLEREMLSLCVLFSSERFDGKRNLKRSVQRERLSRRNLPLRNNNAGAVSLSRPSLSRFKAFQRGENEREIDARVVRREILIAGGGGSKLPPKDQSHLARALVALSFSLSS